MFKNYCISAWRTLARNKVFSFINVFGLAIGIAVFLLIFEYVAFEWSANRFINNYNQLYLVNTTHKESNPDNYIQPGFAALFQQQVSGIDAYVRLTQGIEAGIVTAITADNKSEPKSFREDRLTYVDGNFFAVFSYKIKAGYPSLQQPKTCAVSESTAKKYFGTADVVGKNISINNQFGKTTYTITAVYADMPQQSDFKSDFLLSFSTLSSAANRNENNWADPNTLESSFVQLFLLLDKNADVNNVTRQLTNVFHHTKPQLQTDAIALQPLKYLHLAPSFGYPFQTMGSLPLVVALFAASLLIVFIAWINYINLSTAQALRRAKEVGVRKVLGATRKQLILQYLTEALLLTLCSAMIAVGVAYMLQPLANNFTGKQLSLNILYRGWLPVAAFAMLLIGSLLSGCYIAFVLSAFKPVTIIKQSAPATRGFSLRKALVVFQFTISIVFIIATIVLYNQLQYMHTEKLGMNISQLLVIKGTSNSSEEQADRNLAFKNVLSSLPWVKQYTATNNLPGSGYNFTNDGITSLNPKKGDDAKSYAMFICDNNYFNTYRISFAQGETFSKLESEKGWMNCYKVIINEKAAAQLGFAANDNIAGKKIKWGDNIYEIKGVVKDYHHLSLHQTIDPMIFLPNICFNYFTIQTDASGMQQKLATLQTLSKQYFPETPFEYFFEDEAYDKQYADDQKLGNVFIASASVAVVIACLGLFGLAAFASQQRIKEIGIRKVLGASVASITGLLSKDFLKLVVIAFIIASPIAWLVMNNWLLNFAYRISINWWVFAVAGITAVLIALLTIGFQAIKAAIANPVNSLRTE